MERYTINIVTRMMIYKGQSIEGCCGNITTEYFIFSAVPKDGAKPEQIVVGSDCGRQFLALLDESLPPRFNAVKNNSKNASSKSRKSSNSGNQASTQLFEMDRYVDELTPLNREYYNAIHLLVSSWNGVCSGVISDMLTYLRKNPNKNTHTKWLQTLNRVIKKDRRNRGLAGMAAGLRKDNPGLMYFDFPLIEQALAEVGDKLKL